MTSQPQSGTTTNQGTLLDRTPPSRSSTERKARRRSFLQAGVVAALIVAGFSSMIGPADRDAGTPLADFSAARASTHIGEIAVEPHPIGSPAIRVVEAYITEQLVQLGLEPDVQTVEVPDYFGSPGEVTAVRNVVAVIPGTAPTKAIALVAHYDTVPASPGANDNSAAVAVLLETARATLAGDRPTNDILLLFTDGEEPNPRFGATAFADSHAAFADIGVVVNLEAVGSSGPSLLVESSRPETGVVDAYRATGARPAAFSFLTETVDLFGGVGTDFDVFKDNAVPGLSFAYLRGSPIYHTSRDVPATVSMSSVQHHGENTMAVVRAFGNTDLPPSSARSDVVFFSVTPFLTVGYSSFVATLTALLTVGAFVTVTWRRLRSRRSAVVAILHGGWVTAAGSVASAIAVFLAWWALTAVRSTPGMWESYVYLALLCGVAAVVFTSVCGALAGRSPHVRLGTGIVGAWVVLGVVTTIALPGFSYLFVWPALAGVAALAGSSSRRFGDWLWLVVAAPALFLAIPALDVFFQMAQPRPGNPDSDLTATAGVVGLFVALILGLILPFLPRRT